MERRKLENLNLLDDFLFGAMVTYPGIGEAFVKTLLKIIFRRDFDKLIIVPQKIYYGTDTDKHGARLDVYLEEPSGTDPGKATVYDMEPDRNADARSLAALPKRTRFYHAKIDSNSLRSGEGYHFLKNVIVIMITPYDPFGMDHMVYTIKNGCVEIPEMPYDDGARTLYLYTGGTKGNPPEELRQLLHYMEHTSAENAENEMLRDIDKMVRTVKQDGEVSSEYMKIFEREEMLIRQGFEQGIEQGREMERKRADAAERELALLKKEFEKYKRESNSPKKL